MTDLTVTQSTAQTYNEAMVQLIRAGNAVAAARVEEANAFSRHRLLLITDRQAQAAAVIETGSAIDIAMAEWEAAKAYLQVAVANVTREGV